MLLSHALYLSSQAVSCHSSGSIAATCIMHRQGHLMSSCRHPSAVKSLGGVCADQSLTRWEPVDAGEPAHLLYLLSPALTCSCIASKMHGTGLEVVTLSEGEIWPESVVNIHLYVSNTAVCQCCGSGSWLEHSSRSNDCISTRPSKGWPMIKKSAS